MRDRFEELARLLREVNRGVFHLARDMRHGHGLPHPSLAVMRLVFRRPAITVSEISRHTGMAKSHVSKTVEGLSGMGLLEKRKDPSDQRVLRIHPTAEAMARFREMQAVTEERLSSVVSTLPPEKVDALIDGLRSLQAALDRAAADVPGGHR